MKKARQPPSLAAGIGAAPEIFYPGRDTVCSEAFSRFLTEYHANLDAFFFVVKLVARADENRVRAAEALLPSASTEEDRQRYEKSIADKGLILRGLQKHATVQSQNLTNGAVNSFQRYFSSIIQIAANKRPSLMISSQHIRVDDVFRFTRHKDLVSFIIDRKVNDLSYGGLSEMERYFDERLGIKMFESEEQRNLLRLFIEARNINVHNGGIVNELFMTRVGNVDGYVYTKGKRLHIDMDQLVALSENAMRVALSIDGLVTSKFRLRRQSHRAWRGEKPQ